MHLHMSCKSDVLATYSTRSLIIGSRPLQDLSKAVQADGKVACRTHLVRVSLDQDSEYIYSSQVVLYQIEEMEQGEGPGSAVLRRLLPAGGLEGRVTSAGVNSDSQACSLL